MCCESSSSVGVDSEGRAAKIKTKSLSVLVESRFFGVVVLSILVEFVIKRRTNVIK